MLHLHDATSLSFLGHTIRSGGSYSGTVERIERQVALGATRNAFVANTEVQFPGGFDFRNKFIRVTMGDGGARMFPIQHHTVEDGKSVFQTWADSGMAFGNGHDDGTVQDGVDFVQFTTFPERAVVGGLDFAVIDHASKRVDLASGDEDREWPKCWPGGGGGGGGSGGRPGRTKPAVVL